MVTAGLHLCTNEIGVGQMHFIVSNFSISSHLDSDSHAYTHVGWLASPSLLSLSQPVVNKRRKVFCTEQIVFS